MNRYLRAVSDNFISFAMSVVFFLAITPLAIRVMGGEFYGLWVVMNALMLFSNVGNLGIGAIVMKFSSETPSEGDPSAQFNRIMSAGYVIVLAMSVVTALLLLLAGDVISHRLDTSLELEEQFRHSMGWIAAAVFPQFLSRVPQGLLLAQLQNRAARRIDVFASMSLWLGAVALSWIGRNLEAIAAWCFISSLLAFGLYVRAAGRLTVFHFRWDAPTLHRMLDFSGYMFLESLAISLFQQFDKVIVGITLGPALAGVYSVGTSLALRLPIITGQATEVMIPYASLQKSLGDQEKLYTVFRRLSRYVSLGLAGISSLLIIWMNGILSLWISPDYAARYADAFRLLIVAYSLLSLSRPAHQTLTGIGKVRFTALIYSFSTFLMLAGLFFLSRRFGLAGAVASNFMLVFLLAFNISVYSILDGSFSWRRMFSDLHWGLWLPPLVYGVDLFLSKSNPSLQPLETLALGTLFAGIFAKSLVASVLARLSPAKCADVKSLR